MVIGGLVFLVVGMMAAFEVAARARPLIRCYREGVEFNLIARSSLDRVSHVPALARLAWNILSLQGIRARRVRVAWTGLESVFALDIPMGQILRIRGIAAEASGEAASTEIGFQQFELHTSVLKIASILQTLAADPSLQQQLPTWT